MIKTIKKLVLRDFCYAFFLLLFGASFTFVFFATLCDPVYTYSKSLLLSAFVIVGCVLFLLNRLFTARETFFTRHYRKILYLFALLFFTLNVGAGVLLRYDPVFDLEAIYQGAIHWIENGTFSDYTSDTCHTDYFYIFPNNLGALALFSLLFRAARLFGISDYFMTATVFNTLLFVCTLLLTSLCCRRLAGIRAGLLVPVLFLLSPAFWIIGPVFYTDALSMLFPMLAFWLFLRSREVEARRQKILYAILVSAVLAIGFLLKATVLIAGAAILIWLILNREWKALLTLGVILLVLVFLLQLGFQQYIYSTQLNRETAEQKNTPITYWLNLAFSEDGRYNHTDFRLSQIEDPVERRKLLTAALQEKLDTLGFSGTCSLFGKKLATLFGDGTLALSDFLDDRPESPSALQEWVTYEGTYYPLYSSVCTGGLLLLLFLMLCSLGWRGVASPVTIAQLSVFGILFFLLFWEINSRYITNFVPFIYLCAAIGADRLYKDGEAFLRKKLPAKWKKAT